MSIWTSKWDSVTVELERQCRLDFHPQPYSFMSVCIMQKLKRTDQQNARRIEESLFEMLRNLQSSWRKMGRLQESKSVFVQNSTQECMWWKQGRGQSSTWRREEYKSSQITGVMMGTHDANARGFNEARRLSPLVTKNFTRPKRGSRAYDYLLKLRQVSLINSREI